MQIDLVSFSFRHAVYDKLSCSLKLWILAHLANCKSMLEAFEDGGDFHSRTAMNMYPYIRDAVNEKHLLLIVKVGHHYTEPWIVATLMSELLISRNADINAMDNDGQTPLHYAVVCEQEVIAEYLVKHNADTDLKDNDGSSSHDM
ncbi:hypothetical protein HN51_062562 [Arachis hypogaea]|nr:ankyrin repeat domain-containing protein 1-like [Arachis hypogaea]